MTNNTNHATRYTALNRSGELLYRHCTVENAAHIILEQRGGVFKIKPIYLTWNRRFDDVEKADAFREKMGLRYDPKKHGDAMTDKFCLVICGFRLWTYKSGNNKQWRKTSIFSLKKDRKQAENEIYQKVFENKKLWRGCVFMTDTDYNVMFGGK